ncbi:MAG: hypothetical protein ACNFW9_00820 [Candidatus Kerfeldbacteria bacterium]
MSSTSNQLNYMRVENKEEEKKIDKFIPPQPIGKVATLIGLVVASTALFWLAWHNAITSGLSFAFSWENILLVLSTLLAMCLMFTILAMAEVLVTKRIPLLLMAIFSSATMFLFFKPSFWSMVGFLLMLLAFLAWRREIRQDEKTRVKFVPQKIIDSGLKMAVSLILLAACFNFFSFMTTRPNAEIETMNSLVSNSTETVESGLLLYYGDRYDPDMELDTFINNISSSVGDAIIDDKVKVDTGNEELDNALGDAITDSLGVVQQEVVEELRNSFLATFNIEATGDESMNSIIEKIVHANITEFVDPYLEFVPALLAVGLFFLLNIFNFIYRELIKWFSYLLFHIFIWIKFIHIKKIQIEAEKIALSE